MLDVLCSTSGINTGTPACAPIPGVGKYLVVWGGKLSPSQLAAGYATCKAALIADSKKSKTNSSKLSVFPIVREFTSKKEANTEATLADGFKQVTREGLPAYEMKVVTDMFQAPELRKLNNKRIKYAIVDDKNQFLATMNTAGEFLGRGGKLFTDGIDAHGYSNVDGETMILLQADNAFETFDNAKCIELDKSPEGIFSALQDIQMYEKATATPVVVVAATAATRTVTITAVGADGDTIDIQDADGNSLTGGPVAKTSAETTVTLLAVLIKNALNAATGTNGGYSATNSSGVITITAPASLGATVNTIDTAPIVVGTITDTHTAFTGGVTGTNSTILHVSGKIISPNANKVIDFYTDYSTTALGTSKPLWKITNDQTGLNVPVTTLATNVAGYFDVTPTPATVAALASGDTLTVELVAPETLDAAGVVGIESVAFTYTKP
jgi:hypothetical protein